MVQSGENIGLTIELFRSVVNDKIKRREVLGLLYLASVKDFGRGKVGQVLIIREDRYTQRSALEVAPLFGKAIHNCQELFVVDFIVYLSGLELPKVKGYGIKSSVITLL